MPTISLTLPVSGTQITAGLHASNYTAIQTLLNGGLDSANMSPSFSPGNPTGTILMWGAAAAPSGYVLCDGASFLRSGAGMDALFAVIGTVYGAADGSHFNVPDLRGRVPVGYAASGGHTDVSTLANTDGSALANRRPKHKHTVGNPTVNSHSHGGNTGTISADHTHTYGSENVSLTSGGTVYKIIGNAGTAANSTGGVSSNHTHGISAESPGTSGGTVGPQTGAEPTDGAAYVVVNYIIKT